jgi:hypothetical protein
MKGNTREKTCRSCGVNFTAIRSKHGNWPSTCSPRCRLAATDRLLAVIQEQRDRLAASIAGEQPPPAADEPWTPRA